MIPAGVRQPVEARRRHRRALGVVLGEPAVAAADDPELRAAADGDVDPGVVVEVAGGDRLGRRREQEALAHRPGRPGGSFGHEQRRAVLGLEPEQDVGQAVAAIDVGGEGRGDPSGQAEDGSSREVAMAVAGEKRRLVAAARQRQEVLVAVGVEVAAQQEVGRQGNPQGDVRGVERSGDRAAILAARFRLRGVGIDRVRVAGRDDDRAAAGRAEAAEPDGEVRHAVGVEVRRRQRARIVGAEQGALADGVGQQRERHRVPAALLYREVRRRGAGVSRSESAERSACNCHEPNPTRSRSHSCPDEHTAPCSRNLAGAYSFREGKNPPKR